MSRVICSIECRDEWNSHGFTDYTNYSSLNFQKFTANYCFGDFFVKSFKFDFETVLKDLSSSPSRDLFSSTLSRGPIMKFFDNTVIYGGVISYNLYEMPKKLFEMSQNQKLSIWVLFLFGNQMDFRKFRRWTFSEIWSRDH